MCSRFVTRPSPPRLTTVPLKAFEIAFDGPDGCGISGSAACVSQETLKCPVVHSIAGAAVPLLMKLLCDYTGGPLQSRASPDTEVLARSKTVGS